jgi:hypothetical protein
VQPASQEHHSAGIYSVLHDKWIHEPEHEEPTVDPKAWARRILNDAEKGKYKSLIGIKFAKEALRVK